MSVYNTAEYLREAIESILNQTFTDFEFIIVNDCSTDKSEEIINSYHDRRIIYIKNEKNMGRAATPNRGLKICRGEFVARQDSDDISFPNRLKTEYDFLKKHPLIDICGSWIKIIGTDKIWKVPTRPELISPLLLFGIQIFHPTIMWRAESFKRLNLSYDSTLRESEDYDLLSRAAKFLKMANIKKILLDYRTDNNKTNKFLNSSESQAIVNSIRKRSVNELIVKTSPEEDKIHQKISNGQVENDDELDCAEKWLIKLVVANDEKKLYAIRGFREVMRQQWLTIVLRNKKTPKFKLLINSPIFGSDFLQRIINLIILAIKIKLS
jgi:Glycosyltransferases involved in cell wall biogenesis